MVLSQLLDSFLNLVSSRNLHLILTKAYWKKVTTSKTLQFCSIDRDTKVEMAKWRHKSKSISKFQRQVKLLASRAFQTTSISQVFNKVGATKQLLTNGDVEGPWMPTLWASYIGKWMISGKDPRGQAWSSVVDGSHYTTQLREHTHQSLPIC